MSDSAQDSVDLALPWRPVRMRLISGEAHYREVVTRVIGATCSVWIATANLKELMLRPEGIALRRRGSRGRGYRSSLELFDKLAGDGVELRILHASLPSRRFQEAFDRFPRLVGGGLQLRLCPRVHLKAVVVDGELLYLGSANWTGAGLGVKSPDRRNFELGVITEDPALLDQVQGLYQSIWSGEPCSRCSLRESCEAPLDLG